MENLNLFNVTGNIYASLKNRYADEQADIILDFNEMERTLKSDFHDSVIPVMVLDSRCNLSFAPHLEIRVIDNFSTDYIFCMPNQLKEYKVEKMIHLFEEDCLDFTRILWYGVSRMRDIAERKENFPFFVKREKGLRESSYTIRQEGLPIISITLFRDRKIRVEKIALKMLTPKQIIISHSLILETEHSFRHNWLDVKYQDLKEAILHVIDIRDDVKY